MRAVPMRQVSPVHDEILWAETLVSPYGRVLGPDLESEAGKGNLESRRSHFLVLLYYFINKEGSLEKSCDLPKPPHCTLAMALVLKL